MKYQALLLLFFHCFLFYHSHAQTDETPQDPAEVTDYSDQDNKDFTFKRYKWDVGTDLGQLLSRIPFVQAQDPNFLFIIQLRKNVLESVPNQFAKRKAAYRIRLGFNTGTRVSDKSDTMQINGNPLFNREIYTGESVLHSALLSIGKEWQKQLGRFQLFYGLDLQGSITNQKTFYNSYRNINGTMSHFQETETNKKIYYGLSPFIGMKFFIHNRISISTEAAFHLFKEDHIKKATNYLVKTNRKASFIGASISPVSFLSMNYHF